MQPLGVHDLPSCGVKALHAAAPFAHYLWQDDVMREATSVSSNERKGPLNGPYFVLVAELATRLPPTCQLCQAEQTDTEQRTVKVLDSAPSRHMAAD